MNHSTLEIFIQVAETQSVTQAAKRLGRAQSNITTRIQQLRVGADKPGDCPAARLPAAAAAGLA